MFPTTRLAFSIFVTLSLSSGCTEKRSVPKELLPMPGAPSAMSEKIVRPNLDKSPMDMIYFPVDYPVLKMSGKTNKPPIARVIYSRPEKDGRVIFGNVVQYDQQWRLGANEATEIEFFTDVSIQNKPVAKGRYVLYCIPHADKWTLKLNSSLFVWGLKIPASGDLHFFDVPATTSDIIFEAFTMEFKPNADGMQLEIAWDNVKAVLPIRY